MTPRFFKSFILVNIFIILTNLFDTFIRFFRKTSVITVATLPPVLICAVFQMHFDGHSLDGTITMPFSTSSLCLVHPTDKLDKFSTVVAPAKIVGDLHSGRKVCQLSIPE